MGVQRNRREKTGRPRQIRRRPNPFTRMMQYEINHEFSHEEVSQLFQDYIEYIKQKQLKRIPQVETNFVLTFIQRRNQVTVEQLINILQPFAIELSQLEGLENSSLYRQIIQIIEALRTFPLDSIAYLAFHHQPPQPLRRVRRHSHESSDSDSDAGPAFVQSPEVQPTPTLANEEEPAEDAMHEAEPNHIAIQVDQPLAPVADAAAGQDPEDEDHGGMDVDLEAQAPIQQQTFWQNGKKMIAGTLIIMIAGSCIVLPMVAPLAHMLFNGNNTCTSGTCPDSQPVQNTTLTAPATSTQNTTPPAPQIQPQPPVQPTSSWNPWNWGPNPSQPTPTAPVTTTPAVTPTQIPTIPTPAPNWWRYYIADPIRNNVQIPFENQIGRLF